MPSVCRDYGRESIALAWHPCGLSLALASAEHLPGYHTRESCFVQEWRTGRRRSRTRVLVNNLLLESHQAIGHTLEVLLGMILPAVVGRNTL